MKAAILMVLTASSVLLVLAMFSAAVVALLSTIQEYPKLRTFRVSFFAGDNLVSIQNQA